MKKQLSQLLSIIMLTSVFSLASVSCGTQEVRQDSDTVALPFLVWVARAGLIWAGRASAKRAAKRLSERAFKRLIQNYKSGNIRRTIGRCAEVAGPGQSRMLVIAGNVIFAGSHESFNTFDVQGSCF